ncbi:MAG: isoprenyl transferase [Lachnospiraceae bacterium]|nr:isoprenyl transferase [Lachnospiraceae bacterium]
MPEKKNNELIIPEHVAVILDGNGRWAKKRGLPRKLGHKAGCDNLEQMVEDSARIGLKYFTVYAFSTENWKRSEEEVEALMGFFLTYIKRLRERAMKNNIRVAMIGDRSRFSDELQELLNDTIAVTSANTGMTFVMALNYGSRDEITRAVRSIGEQVASGTLKPEDITEDTISGNLDTAGMPDPDLLIRTSGELRLSNYMLWQLAYSEFYFSDVLWPDFHKEQLMEAIVEFNKRNRRFGGR